MNRVKNVLARILAVVVATALGTIGAGSIIGFDVAKTAALAAILAVAVVVEDLARAFIADGKLDDDEINAVFAKAAADPDAPAPVAEASEPDLKLGK